MQEKLFSANVDVLVQGITPGPPIQWPEWNKKPVDDSQISELLARIADLRQKNVTGEAVIFD